MSWQNLTPQLRTRLNRLERFVGLFVALAVFCLLFGIGYYLYQTAQRKGWFKVKAPYFTLVDTAAGMRIGDKVYLMGFEAGEIVRIDPMPPFAEGNIYIGFVVQEPYYGYLWQDSRARVAAGDFLGNRSIEVTKGVYGMPTYLLHELRQLTVEQALALPEPHSWKFNQEILDPGDSTKIANVYGPVTPTALNRLARLGTNEIQAFDAQDYRNRIMAILDDTKGCYVPFTRDSKEYYLKPEESPALTERLAKVADVVENALPNILQLTNRLNDVLAQFSALTARADQLVAHSQPVVTNLNQITSQLRDPNGSLGQWLIPSDLRQELDHTVLAARDSLRALQATMETTQTNLAPLAGTLFLSLENLAQITSNLNAQVQANQFILSDLSDLVRHTDQTVQGLKRHWLLKGAFANETNPAPTSLLHPSLAPWP